MSMRLGFSVNGLRFVFCSGDDGRSAVLPETKTEVKFMGIDSWSVGLSLWVAAGTGFRVLLGRLAPLPGCWELFGVACPGSAISRRKSAEACADPSRASSNLTCASSSSRSGGCSVSRPDSF